MTDTTDIAGLVDALCVAVWDRAATSNPVVVPGFDRARGEARVALLEAISALQKEVSVAHMVVEEARRNEVRAEAALTEQAATLAANAATIARQAAQIQALERDAGRYRYLRQIDRSIEWENLLLCKWGTITGSDQIDAAIDSAQRVARQDEGGGE